MTFERPAAFPRKFGKHGGIAGASPAKAEVFTDDKAVDAVFFRDVVRKPAWFKRREFMREVYLLHARYAKVTGDQVPFGRREKQFEVVTVKEHPWMALEGDDSPAGLSLCGFPLSHFKKPPVT